MSGKYPKPTQVPFPFQQSFCSNDFKTKDFLSKIWNISYSIFQLQQGQQCVNAAMQGMMLKQTLGICKLCVQKNEKRSKRKRCQLCLFKMNKKKKIDLPQNRMQLTLVQL